MLFPRLLKIYFTKGYYLSSNKTTFEYIIIHLVFHTLRQQEPYRKQKKLSLYAGSRHAHIQRKRDKTYHAYCHFSRMLILSSSIFSPTEKKGIIKGFLSSCQFYPVYTPLHCKFYLLQGRNSRFKH